MRMHARARAGDYTYFHNSIFPSSTSPRNDKKTTRQFTKNNTLFYEKRHVVLWKTSRHFIENNTSFYGKRYVVL